MHAAVAIKMIDCSAAISSKHSARVRVVHHHDAIVFFRQRAKLRQQRNVSVHGKHAVGDNQFFPRKTCMFLQNSFAVLCVLVFENLDGRSREPRTIDDGRVIQFVRNDQVLFAEHRGDCSRIRRKS